MKRKTKKRLSQSQRRYKNRFNREKPVKAYFPVTCDCGFTAHGPEELKQHEHDVDRFDT